MKYASQKVALVYFAGAMALFVVQLLFGLLAAAVYTMPNFLVETVPFNILRMIHTNALVVWLLMGFFGAAYYLVPEEAERGHCQVVGPKRTQNHAARLSSSSRRHLDARLLPPHPEGFGTSTPVLHSGHQVSPRTEVAVDHGVG